jgi:hypothetical protein
MIDEILYELKKKAKTLKIGSVSAEHERPPRYVLMEDIKEVLDFFREEEK